MLVLDPEIKGFHIVCVGFYLDLSLLYLALSFQLSLPFFRSAFVVVLVVSSPSSIKSSIHPSCSFRVF